MTAQVYDLRDEDSLMQPALAAAAKAVSLHTYFIGGALFASAGHLVAQAYGATVIAGEIYHGETQLAVLLRAGRASGVFPVDEWFTLVTTLQPCPQCRQICIQQKKLLVLYGAPTPTSGAELGDLLETYTNTEKRRIEENDGQPVVRPANLSAVVRQQCVEGHRQHRNPVLRVLDEVSMGLMPFTDLLELVETTDPTVIPRIRAFQDKRRGERV